MLEARDATTRDRILASARSVAQAQGYGGVSFRDLARDVGIKPASVYHYFPSKADLGVAVARRYWEDTAAALETLSADTADALSALRNLSRCLSPVGVKRLPFRSPVRPVWVG
ncbi:TetR/AcrR family transcriptional regulator [Mycolicibacterium smegmatis]|uniref:TetR/AcrR family transcriptional regulator n=1 Tax=Mycolicibacterium smegmatis TaxID=1772 RepID=UPI003A0FD4B1|nr:TetR/AcrR family transcriptional regulator [Mycolicibacterium smegmatis]